MNTDVSPTAPGSRGFHRSLLKAQVRPRPRGLMARIKDRGGRFLAALMARLRG